MMPPSHPEVGTGSTRKKFLPALLGALGVFQFGMLVGYSFNSAKTVASTNLKGTITIKNTTIAVITENDAAVHRPFEMPIKGERFEISQPFYDMPQVANNDRGFFMGEPQAVVTQLQERISWLDSFAVRPNRSPSLEHARLAYTEMVKHVVSGMSYGLAEYAVHPRTNTQISTLKAFNEQARKIGTDWAYLGDTMTGWARIDNVRDLIKDVIQNDIDGDYIETGVWRGGSSIFARSVLRAYDNGDRKSYVCDSFAGLPPGDRGLDNGDKGWDNSKYLEVPAETVAQGFQKFNLLDHNVIFAKGFFNETMKPLSQHIEKLAVMRLDGDMYESTVDVLYRLYDKLSIGGYLIMDDWFGFPSKTACEDFFAVHGINPEIIQVDKLSIYWKKTEQVEIQYWRYEQNKFKKDDQNSA